MYGLYLIVGGWVGIGRILRYSGIITCDGMLLTRVIIITDIGFVIWSR